MNFGKMLRKKRRDKDMTIRSLAEISGVVENYITQIEKYNKLPSMKVMRSLISPFRGKVKKGLIFEYLKDKSKKDDVVNFLFKICQEQLKESE